MRGAASMGIGVVILTTVFGEDYSATLVGRSAACRRLRSRLSCLLLKSSWGERFHTLT
jgi:hypothetical protein